jgi:hypothetical protein
MFWDGLNTISKAAKIPSMLPNIAPAQELEEQLQVLSVLEKLNRKIIPPPSIAPTITANVIVTTFLTIFLIITCFTKFFIIGIEIDRDKSIR